MHGGVTPSRRRRYGARYVAVAGYAFTRERRPPHACGRAVNARTLERVRGARGAFSCQVWLSASVASGLRASEIVGRELEWAGAPTIRGDDTGEGDAHDAARRHASRS